MFEVGKTVTRTYIIKPPASGPIEACYAIYAHWAPAINVPVKNPATDFGPEANSPMPYDFAITQDAVVDPDAPADIMASHIIWRVKTWGIAPEFWDSMYTNLLYTVNTGDNLLPAPNGQPDCYVLPQLNAKGYICQPDGMPGKWPYLFRLEVYDPDTSPTGILGEDQYIFYVEFGALDGQW